MRSKCSDMKKEIMRSESALLQALSESSGASFTQDDLELIHKHKRKCHDVDPLSQTI